MSRRVILRAKELLSIIPVVDGGSLRVHSPAPALQAGEARSASPAKAELQLQ